MEPDKLIIIIAVIGISVIIGVLVLVYVFIQEKKKKDVPATKVVEGKIQVKGEEKPMFSVEEQVVPTLAEFRDPKTVDVKYSLIPPYTYARIRWDEANTELVYEIYEPELTKREKETLMTLEDGIRELINLSYISVNDRNTIMIYLEKNVKILLTELSIELTKEQFLKIMYYIYRDFVGLNELEPLMNDYFIEDVECNGINSPVYVVHRKYRNVRTNLVYTDINLMASFIEKIAQKCGKYVSYAEPLLDGSLPDGSRVNATYTKDVTSKGPTFTIRKFTREPWSPITLMDKGSVNAEILTYIWMMIEYENSFMVVGGTGSGKTSFLNACAFFIPPQARVVSIEDTRELQLEHENWLPSVSRAGVGMSNILGEKRGEVTLFDLLKASFRQRPDYIIVGEVRGQEAYILFQAFASIRGDEEVMVLNDKHPKKIKIKDMKPGVNYQVITFDEEGNAKIVPVRNVKEHPPRKELCRITTKSGRQITISPDHSVFGYDNGMKSMFASELREGGNIVVPARIPCGYADIKEINLVEAIAGIRVFAPEYIRAASKKIGYKRASELCSVASISDYYANFTKKSMPNAMPAEKFRKLMKEADMSYDIKKVKTRVRHGKIMNGALDVSDELLKLAGYYISEGNVNFSGRNSSIKLYNNDAKILDDMRRVIKKLDGKYPRERRCIRGYGNATELSCSNKLLAEFLVQTCGEKTEKRIPDFMFGLSKEKIGVFLSALFEGDGTLNRDEFGYYTTSKKLAGDVSQILLAFGVFARISSRQRKGRKTKDYEILAYRTDQRKELLKYLKPVSKKAMLTKTSQPNSRFVNDVYIDKIQKIEKIELERSEPVYDLVVPETHNFIGGFGGIVLHNSGHPGFATMHAESTSAMIRRLETSPINLSGSLVMTLNAVCIMSQTRVHGKLVRRLSAIDEVIEVKEGLAGETLNNVFKWDPRTDIFAFNPKSRLFDYIATHYGLTQQQVLNEFKLRTQLLKVLCSRKITGYKEVQKIIYEYYQQPATVLRKFGVIR